MATALRLARPPGPAGTASPQRDVRSILTPSTRTPPALLPSRLEAVSSLPRTASQRGSVRRKRRYLGDGPVAPAPTPDLRGPRCRRSAPRRTQSPDSWPMPTGSAGLADRAPAKGRPGCCRRRRSLARRRAARLGREPTPRHRFRQGRGTNQSPSQGAPLRQHQPISAAVGLSDLHARRPLSQWECD